MSLESTPSDFILWRIAPSGIPMLFILWYLDMSVLLLDEEDELDELEEDFFFFLKRRALKENDQNFHSYHYSNEIEYFVFPTNYVHKKNILVGVYL